MDFLHVFRFSVRFFVQGKNFYQLLQVFGAMITENGQKYLEGPRGLDYCSILFKIA